MPLYHIQDADRPAWIVAASFAEALARYELAVSAENDGDKGSPPRGIQHVADDDEIIVGNEFLPS